MVEVDLDAQVQVQVIAGLLGVSTSMIYGLSKQGRLKLSCSYRECIRDYVNYWKDKVNGRQTSIGEMVQVRKAELDRARVQQVWLAIQKERGELIDKHEFGEVLGRLFSSIRGQLLALGKRYKAEGVREDVDVILENWAKLGEAYLCETEKTLKNFESDQIQVLQELEDALVPVEGSENE